MIVMILFYGEIVFRIIIIYNIEKFSLIASRLVSFVNLVFYPFSWATIKLSCSLTKLLGIKDELSGDFITQDQIRLLVEEGEEQGIFEEQEREMIHSIIEFGETLAREIMVPRISMVCVEVNKPVDNVLNAIIENFSIL